jgi:hypothetical protein
MKEHIPKKLANNILLVNIEAKNSIKGLISGAII